MADSSEQRPALLGDLEFARCSGGSCGDDSQVVNVLKSSDDDTKIPQSIVFRVDINDTSSTNTSLVLCWVDSEGTLGHHYTYNGNILDHYESTYTGDTFVVYQTSIETKPQTISEYHILLSYKLQQALDQKTHTHYIKWTSEGCEARCALNDNEYRVVAGLPSDHPHRLPSPNKSWEITYTYICPPIPNSSTWNSNNQTFYIWGDIDFDNYGASHLREVTNELRNIHDYNESDSTSQVMIGNCLSSNDENYIYLLGNVLIIGLFRRNTFGRIAMRIQEQCVDL